MSPELFSFDNENIGHGKRLPTTTSTSWELRSFNLLSLTIRELRSRCGNVGTQEGNVSRQSLNLPSFDY